MPPFTVNTPRIDPYRAFAIRLTWQGRPVAGFSKVSALGPSTRPVRVLDGNAPETRGVLSGPQSLAPLTLERGLSHDADFVDWARRVTSADGAGAIAQRGGRADMLIEMRNAQGRITGICTVRDCWVSDCFALPERDANASGVAIERMVLHHGGWSRSVDTAGPTET